MVPVDAPPGRLYDGEVRGLFRRDAWKGVHIAFAVGAGSCNWRSLPLVSGRRPGGAPLRRRERYHGFYAGSGMWAMLVMGILFIATDRMLIGSIMIIGALVILILLIAKRDARDRPHTSLEIALALCTLILLPILISFELLIMPFHPLIFAFFTVLLILEGLAPYKIRRAWRRPKEASGDLGSLFLGNGWMGEYLKQ